MDLTKLRKALGLADTATEQEIFAASAQRITAGLAATSENDKIKAALAAGGFKLEGDKVVQLAHPPTGARPDDDEEKKALKARLDAVEKDGARARIAAAQVEVEKLIKDGRVPPAVRTELTQLMSVAGKAQALALSAQGGDPILAAFDVFECAKKVFNALPAVTAEKLAQLGAMAPMTDEEKKAQESLSTMGKAIARRVSAKKQEAAASK